MDGTQNLDIGCQEVTVKNKRVKKTGGSKIFKKLLDILHSGSERHVIQFTNDDKTEFEVKLTDKKNKKQWTEKDISLFLALDSISSKPREQKNLAEASKNRFKSNMTKLESAGYLEYLGPRQVSKAVVYKKYRILKACPIRDETEEGYSLESTDTESKESSVDVSGSLGSPLKGSFSFPNTSHYSCLSGESSENDVYTSVTYPNVESLIYVPEANGEVVGGKEYVAAEQNLSEKQYVEPPNSKNDVYTSVTYPNVESLIYVPEANGEVVGGKEYVAAEQNISEKQYVEPPNSKNDVYTSVTYENVESLIYLPVANGEVVGGKEYVAVAAEQNLSEKQYVEPPNSKNDVYTSVTYENVESLIYVPVANGEVVGGKEYVAVAAEQNLSEKQYVEPPNSKNDVYTSVTYENVESLIYVPVANGEVVGGKEYVAVAAEQNLSEKQYVEPPNSKNDVYTSVTYQNVESLIYLPEANGEVVRGKEYVAVAAEQNLSEKQYVEPPNSNKRKLNFPDTQNKKCRELDWSPTKSYSDDLTLFEETEDDNEIFKDSANPFLSSALVSEERPGLISDSDWQNEYKIFSFDPETMYDCI